MLHICCFFAFSHHTAVCFKNVNNSKRGNSTNLSWLKPLCFWSEYNLPKAALWWRGRKSRVHYQLKKTLTFVMHTHKQSFHPSWMFLKENYCVWILRKKKQNKHFQNSAVSLAKLKDLRHIGCLKAFSWHETRKDSTTDEIISNLNNRRGLLGVRWAVWAWDLGTDKCEFSVVHNAPLSAHVKT